MTPYKYNTFLTLVPLLAVLGFFACENKNDNVDACATDFNQQALFENIATNLILPAYTDFQLSVKLLSIVGGDFVDAPSEMTLQSLRQTWKTAYINWQSVAQYEFGPAEMVFLRHSVNNFPASEAAIEANIESGTYNFDDIEAYDKGFPALDYLLYGIGEDAAAIVAHYTSDASASMRLDYLNAVINDIATRTDEVYNAWEFGDYQSTFVQNAGTAAGSSLSLLVNNLNRNYELIKREKLGVPSGVLSLGFTNPTEVEAYYSGISVELAAAAVRASVDLYKGLNGQGLDDYLNAVGAEKNGEALDDLIQTQYTAAITAIESLASPLSETVENDTESVINAYNEVTKQIVNTKTDLPSVLCVSITYIDNPSDSD